MHDFLRDKVTDCFQQARLDLPSDTSATRLAHLIDICVLRARFIASQYRGCALHPTWHPIDVMLVTTFSASIYSYTRILGLRPLQLFLVLTTDTQTDYDGPSYCNPQSVGPAHIVFHNQHCNWTTKRDGLYCLYALRQLEVQHLTSAARASSIEQPDSLVPGLTLPSRD